MLTLQSLIQAIEKAKKCAFVPDQYYGGERAEDTFYIDADILIQELKKTEGFNCFPDAHEVGCPHVKWVAKE